MTLGQNFTLNYDPGHSSTLNYDPNPGHNWTLNHDSGSQFNVELRPGVIIQRGIKTWGHNSMRGVLILSVGGVVIQWPPVTGGRNSTWKIRWILSTARLIKTPRVEIQWGQNSILHRSDRGGTAFQERMINMFLFAKIILILL